MKNLETIYQSLKEGEKTYKYSHLRDELKRAGIEMVAILNLKLKSDREKLLEAAELYLYDELPQEDFQASQEGLIVEFRELAIQLGYTYREHAPTDIRYRFLLIRKDIGCVGFDDVEEGLCYLSDRDTYLKFVDEINESEG